MSNSILAESSGSFFSSTVLVSFALVGYSLYSLKKRLDEIQCSKKEDSPEEPMYQSWTGNFMDDENSLMIKVVRQKACSKKANTDWLEWDGSSDASVVSRNFYLGNSDPSFQWTVKQGETEMEATAKELMTDGWNSVIHMKLIAFLKEATTSDQINAFVKKLIEEDKILWQKTLVSKSRFADLFN